MPTNLNNQLAATKELQTAQQKGFIVQFTGP
jgi:hypothetical protein